MPHISHGRNSGARADDRHLIPETGNPGLLAGARDVTEPFVKAFDLEYDLINSDEDVPKLGVLTAKAFNTKRPVVALITSADEYVPGT